MMFGDEYLLENVPSYLLYKVESINSFALTEVYLYKCKIIIVIL